jgi:hypothetical protein
METGSNAPVARREILGKMDQIDTFIYQLWSLCQKWRLHSNNGSKEDAIAIQKPIFSRFMDFRRMGLASVARYIIDQAQPGIEIHELNLLNFTAEQNRRALQQSRDKGQGV